MENFRDYPLHLRPDELQYELEIRGVYNLRNQRLRTVALRELLKKEELGNETGPKRSSHVYSSSDEIQRCSKIYADVIKIADRAIKENRMLEISESSHRFHHLMFRLERILPVDVGEETIIAELLDCVYDAIHRMTATTATGGNVNRNNRTPRPGRPIPTERPSLTGNHRPSEQNITMTAATEPNVERSNVAILGNTTLTSERPSFSGNIRPAEQNSNITATEPTQQRGENNIAALLNTIYTSETLRPRISGSTRESLFDIEELSPMERSEIELEIGNQRNQASSNQLIDLQLPNRSFSENRFEFPNNFDRLSLRNVVPVPVHRCNADIETRDGLFRDVPMNTYTRNANIDRDVRFDTMQPQFHERVDFPQTFQPTTNQTQRRSVPVNQWKLWFSGDNRGLHLYDFLNQIEMYRRSEKVTDSEMLFSIVHLLSGRAKLWYQSIINSIQSWNELVTALKREFLPTNYEYLLFCEISNRMQKANESFGEYITHMKALFRCLTIPISEEHKLFIIQKNLLSKYAMAIAPLELRSLEELSNACRRIDNASNSGNRSLGINLPFQSYVAYPRTTQNRFNNYSTNVNAIEESHEDIDREEIYSVQRQRNPFRSHHNNDRNDNATNKRIPKCWNCTKNGHNFNECDKPQSGVFCYKCGSRDVIYTNCEKCSGNASRNLRKEGELLNSTNESPQ